MGAVTFSLDPRLVIELKAVLLLNVFVETGTFKGDTAAEMETLFDKVVTIELSDTLAAEAVQRFEAVPNIDVLQGDSAVKLRELRSDLESASSLYWLDAHWCVAVDTAGELSQCPLINELSAIGHLNDQSVILIDDARLFLAPPASPHEISQWPSFHQIVICLFSMNPGHELMVVNDVIVFFPESAKKAMESYAQSCGVDWLDASNCLKENASFMQQLLDKEVVIQQQISSLAQTQADLAQTQADLVHSMTIQTEKDEVIRALARSLNDFDFEKVRGALEAFAKNVLDGLSNYVSRLESECQAKEALVQRQAAELAQRSEVCMVVEPAGLTAPSDDSQLMSQLANKDLQIQQLTTDLAASLAIQIEKEEVIRDLARSLHAYRLAFSAIKPFGFLTNPIAAVTRNVRAMLRPRLGNLNQHPPIKLVLPPTRLNVSELRATPKISIVTPSFRQGAFIEQTLRSVIDQEYPNLEYFVQDGGSEDDTVDVLKRYGGQIAGWASKPDGGQSQAINLGFANSSGEIMAWLNSDDLLLPGALVTVADYFNRHPEVDVVYGDRLLIDENGMQIGRWIMPGHDSAVLSWVDYVPQETLFWRRRIWDRTGSKIDESFRFAMDWDLLVRFRDAGANFAHIPRFLGAFRIHAHQKTSAAINEIGNKEMDRIRERLLGKMPTHVEIGKAILPFMLKHIVADKRYALKVRLGLAR